MYNPRFGFQIFDIWLDILMGIVYYITVYYNGIIPSILKFLWT